MKLHNFRFAILLFSLTAMTFFTGCDLDEICERGLGTRVTEEISLPPLSGFDLKIAGNVYLTQDSVQRVEVVGQENIIALLDLDVDSEGVWDIRYTECVRKVSEFDIYITVPNLDFVKISGSGDVEGQNRFDVDRLSIEISGSGDIELEADATDVDTEISGSGDMKLNLTTGTLNSHIRGSGNMNLTGVAERHDAQITGSGDIRAFDLVTQETYIKISGSGGAEVTAEQVLEVDISGSGDVYYQGTPQVSTSITGSGEVRPR
jgi:hypothetical protein